MNSVNAEILEIRAGTVKRLGLAGHYSAIDKYRQSGPIVVDYNGLAGDAHADLKHHGGPEKAVHHYPVEHYGYWLKRYPENHTAFVTGGFGENISTSGLTEWNVCIGDIFKVGELVLQVSQARQPCWKLNVRFGIHDMGRQVQDSLRTGWYYRVLEPGSLSVGDTLELVERPQPEWPLARLLKFFYQDSLNKDMLSTISTLPHLTVRWRETARRRLETSRVEDWSFRLRTPIPQ